MPELTFDNAGFEFMMGAAGLNAHIEAAVITNNADVENYWGVLEFGSKRGQRPWPTARKKTRYGPDGNVYSKQAVGGFVRVNEAVIFKLLADEYDRVAAQGRMPTQTELVGVVNQAAEATAVLLRKIVPVDSGAFKRSIAVQRAG